jgi:nitroreductase
LPKPLGHAAGRGVMVVDPAPPTLPHLEFHEVVRRRRMVRTYAARPVPRALVDQVVDAGLRAPSAGFTQGVAFVVLEGHVQTGRFWELTSRSPEPPTPGGRLDRLRAAPVILLPLADKAAYLARYAEPDKAHLGQDREEAWPVPYWDLDTAFATMAVLLAATDAGLGALFFGIFHGEAALLADLGVPAGRRAIGAVTLGWPAVTDPPSPSLGRGRRDRSETVHYGRWAGS